MGIYFITQYILFLDTSAGQGQDTLESGIQPKRAKLTSPLPSTSQAKSGICSELKGKAIFDFLIVLNIIL